MLIKYETMGVIGLLILILIFFYDYLKLRQDKQKNEDYIDLRNRNTSNEIYAYKCWIELLIILLVCVLINDKYTYIVMGIVLYFYLPKCFSLVTSLQKHKKLTIWL